MVTYDPTEMGAATAAQNAAGQAPGSVVQLIAGPGSGKSAVIVGRVQWLLASGVLPEEIVAVSFTNASCNDLRSRLVQRIPNGGADVRVRTLHSLALYLLGSAHLLNRYPSTPRLMDEWETDRIYDAEATRALNVPVRRVREIRAAYDAQWQTLNPATVNQRGVSVAEQSAFERFHAHRTNLYNCVLPGEIVKECVDQIAQGNLSIAAHFRAQHLIVDEYQDLNACDQQLVRDLATQGTLFVAGDDDQSIYSFRHANPIGLVQFATTHGGTATHTLAHCFRCAPAVLSAADRLIQYNTQRLPKTPVSMLRNSAPTIPGHVAAWRFADGGAEAEGIASACASLTAAGLPAEKILVLLTTRDLLVDLKAAFDRHGVPVTTPADEPLCDSDDGLRAVHALLRVTVEPNPSAADFLCVRNLLELLHGVGAGTVDSIISWLTGGVSIAGNPASFRAALQAGPVALGGAPNGRATTALSRVENAVSAAAGWSTSDTLSMRLADIDAALSNEVFQGKQAALNTWQSLASSLPPAFTLDQVSKYLSAPNDAERAAILAGSGSGLLPSPTSAVRAMTMHGAKGLDGHVVFIPGMEQGLMPRASALSAPALLQEARRLMYVSLTRARVACILTLAARRNGQIVHRLLGGQHQSAASRFIQESGLVPAPAAFPPALVSQIIADAAQV